MQQVANTFCWIPIAESHCHNSQPGVTDLERGYGDVRPWRPPFHTSPVVRKGPISSKRVSSQDLLLRKFGNFSLYSLNFHSKFSSQAPHLEIFSSQAPKFGNSQFTSPQILKFSVHKPPFSEANISSQAPHFGNPGCTPLPEHMNFLTPNLYSTFAWFIQCNSIRTHTHTFHTAHVVFHWLRSGYFLAKYHKLTVHRIQSKFVTF